MIPQTTSPAAPGSSHFQAAAGSHAGANFFLKKIQDFGVPSHDLRILVAGCGAGHEADWIAKNTAGSVIAVDVDDFVPSELKRRSDVSFQIASVCELPFADQSFDLVFYHHVIEHVDRPQESLVELHRVLKPGGVLFVGTPNRHRLISSIGAHQQSEWESTLANKVKDNLRDWSDRLKGRFQNALGAHAGFSRRELDGMLAPYFAKRQWVTEEYLRYKYQANRFHSLLGLATSRPTAWFVAPSIYAFCQKLDSTES